MAFRMSEYQQGHLSPTTLGAGTKIGAFEDDKTPTISQTPLANTYNGPAGIVVIEFSAIPGLKAAIVKAVKFSPMMKRTLRYEVRQDTAPLFDKYQIKMWVTGREGEFKDESGQISAKDALGMKGQVQGAQGVGVIPLAIVALIIEILIIVGVAAVIGILVWRVFKTNWGKVVSKALSSPLVLGIAIGAAALFLLSRKRGVGGMMGAGSVRGRDG